MSRKLALKSLQMFLADDEQPSKQQKPSFKPSRRNQKIKKKKYQKQTNAASEILEKNLKYFRKKSQKHDPEEAGKKKVLAYLTNPRPNQNMTSAEDIEEDDDTNFGKSILFDDVIDDVKNAGGESGSDNEDVSFGDWSKKTKKRDKQIFQRKK